jgi:ABC-type bacteriocin/lantibiotic exporter with double-glycine peptidase domain
MEESDFKYSVAGWLQETARIMRSLKFNRETDIHLHKTDKYVSGYLKARTAHFKILLLQYWSLIFFKVFITAAMLIVGGFLLLDQQLNVGQFVAAEIVIITVLASIEKFIISLDKVYDVLTSAEKLGKVIDKPMEKSGTLGMSTNQGIAVKVENLTFGYNDDETILQNVSLDAPAGSVVNLLGREGSGKSTLLRLLTGSFTEFSGRILLNGIPIGNYSIHELRKATGIYFSQQEIFSGTLWENISMGNCAYGLDDITRIAERIGLAPFIAQQKNGFNTLLDPVGHRLNKTTTRKILFLRAIADRPKLLLLEEPWEGMDEHGRSQMIDVLLTEMKGSTIIVASNDEGFSKHATHVFDMGNRKS